jgi:hypothetical protein
VKGEQKQQPKSMLSTFFFNLSKCRILQKLELIIHIPFLSSTFWILMAFPIPHYQSGISDIFINADRVTNFDQIYPRT